MTTHRHVLGAASVEVVFLLSRANLPRVRTTSALSGAAIMIVGGLILANVFGGFESSVSAWSMGMILAAPSAIASGVIAKALN